MVHLTIDGIFFFIFLLFTKSEFLKLFHLSCKMFREKEKDSCLKVHEIGNPIPSLEIYQAR